MQTRKFFTNGHEGQKQGTGKEPLTEVSPLKGKTLEATSFGTESERFPTKEPNELNDPSRQEGRLNG